MNQIEPQTIPLNNEKIPSTQQTEETNNKRLLSPTAGTATSSPVGQTLLAQNKRFAFKIELK